MPASPKIAGRVFLIIVILATRQIALGLVCTTESNSVVSATVTEASVTCPDQGQFATGGGCGASPEAPVSNSQPESIGSIPTGWHCNFKTERGPTYTITAFAICCTAPTIALVIDAIFADMPAIANDVNRDGAVTAADVPALIRNVGSAGSFGHR